MRAAYEQHYALNFHNEGEFMGARCERRMVHGPNEHGVERAYFADQSGILRPQIVGLCRIAWWSLRCCSLDGRSTLNNSSSSVK